MELCLSKTEELLAPEEFLKVADTESNNINDVEFVCPQDDSDDFNDFGCFKVSYRTPVFRKSRVDVDAF